MSKSHLTTLSLLLLSICWGCGGGSLSSPAPFYVPLVGEVWQFQNGYGDISTITQETAPGCDGDTCIVWHYQKPTCRAYWNPGDCNAELWFWLTRNADGSWSSTHMEIICSGCISGHSKGTVDNVLNPGGYLIVPVADGDTGHSAYTPYWQLDILTHEQSPILTGATPIPWRTNSYMDGSYRVSEQWENCPSSCTHERWWFARGRGLVRVWQENSDPLTEMKRIILR